MSSDKTGYRVCDDKHKNPVPCGLLPRTDTGENTLNSEDLVLRYTLLSTKPKLHHLP